jgi:hypothetical protein
MRARWRSDVVERDALEPNSACDLLLRSVALPGPAARCARAGSPAGGLCGLRVRSEAAHLANQDVIDVLSVVFTLPYREQWLRRAARFVRWRPDQSPNNLVQRYAVLEWTSVNDANLL